LRHYLLALSLGLRQFGFYLLAIRQTLGDQLTPRRQHPEHGLIGQQIKDETDDREADCLGNQMRPVHSEGPGNLLDLPATLSFRK
jgi:hypothetical protein